ncbi:MAG: hypothetical protein JNM89_12555 [Hyphomicrobiaceae bacterium]|nr:hypothetical protein [Hyphomicrobiaceae bacterium]
MFKRFTLAAVAAAVAILAVPAASEAGHMKRGARTAHASCPVTAMLHRADRAVRTAVVAPRVHVRRERPEWLKALFSRDRAHKRPARAHKRHR